MSIDPSTIPPADRVPPAPPLLATRVLGINCDNPIWVASGPLTDSEIMIRRALAAGAGGVVTKTIYKGASAGLVEKVLRLPQGYLNSTTYSRRSLAEWRLTLRILADEKLPVIVSIHAESPQTLGELAQIVCDAGARALELGIACPNDGAQQSLTPSKIWDYTAAVIGRVSVPCSVKLAADGDYLNQALAAVEAGASAITMSDTLPALDLDTDAVLFRLGGEIGYSGPAIRPIVLRAVHRLRKAEIPGEIIGVGGIQEADHVVQYTQAGATSIQLYSALIDGGLKHLHPIIEGVETYCQHQGEPLQRFVGAATV